jgi:drug/metabolite transporter (DMT)-like permease
MDCLFFVSMKRQQKAYFFAGLSILCWSSISSAFKLSLQHLSPLGLLLIASFTATLFLGITWSLQTKCTISLKAIYSNLRKSLIPGLLNPFVYYLILFEAYSRLRAQEAQALNYTWAIVLAMFSIMFLKEKFRLIDLIALLVSFLGVLIISTRGNLLSMRFDDAPASFLALFTSIIWALYWVINLRDKRPALQKLFCNFLIGFICIGIYAAISKAMLFSAEARLIPAFLGGLYVGIFEMGLTFLLWFRALEYTDNTAKISNLIFLTPFVSLLFIANILHESIHPATLWGLCLIVLSNLVQKGVFRFSKRNA